MYAPRTMALPAMLQSQQKCMTSPLADRQTVSIQYQFVGKQLSPPRIRTRSLKHRFHQSRWSDQFGVYYSRSVTYFQNEENKARKPHDDQNIVSNRHEVLLAWKFLRFGIYWTRHYQYSCIPLSINVFPIIDCAANLYGSLRRAPIVEIQKTFGSGVLHPFARDSRGFSLLHVRRSYSNCLRNANYLCSGLRTSTAPMSFVSSCNMDWSPICLHTASRLFYKRL